MTTLTVVGMSLKTRERRTPPFRSKRNGGACCLGLISISIQVGRLSDLLQEYMSFLDRDFVYHVMLHVTMSYGCCDFVATALK